MTNFGVTVCLAPSAASDVYAALTAAMAPFDFNQANGDNPDGEWDRWRIASSREDRFVVKPQHAGDPRLVHGDDDHEPFRCDGGPRGLLDFDATRRQAIAQARTGWHAQQRDFRNLVADHPAAWPLATFLARHDADPEGYPREQAVADHHAQPLIAALNRASAWERYPSLGVWVLGPESDPITRYTQDCQPDLDKAATWALTEYALLTVDGHWIDPYQLGPFAHLQDGEDAHDSYARLSSSYLDNLHDECIIVRLHCHC